MSSQQYRKGFSGVLFWSFIALLAWLPLPIGSNRPVWVALALLLIALVLAGVILAWIMGGCRLPDAVRRARAVIWIWLAFLAWSVLQAYFACGAGCTAIPEVFVGAWRDAGAETWYWSIDPVASRFTLFQSVLMAGVFAAVILLADSRARLRRLLWTLVCVGLVLSVVTGVFVMDRLEREVFGLTLTQYGWATGSFINRNHFANYLVMCLCAGVGLMISMQPEYRADSWRQRIRNGILTLFGPRARLRVFLALIVVTLVLTRSRMGNMAFFLSLLATGGLALILLRGRQRSLAWLIGSLVAIDILIIGSWFGMDQVVERIQQTVTVQEQGASVNAQDRLGAFRETAQVIRKAPWTGTGAGSYYTLFPHMRQADQKFLDHAHNDYVEFAVEFGLPGFILLLALAGMSGWRALRILIVRRDSLALGLAFASLMAMIAMALHSLVDFSLHIPANAATFVVLLALPWTVSVNEGRAPRRS